MSKQRKPVEVKRVLRVLAPIDAQGEGHVSITVTRGNKLELDFYELQTFPAYDGSVIGVTVVNRYDPNTYHCAIASDRAKSTCDCKGFLRWSKCKHVDALHALQERGQLRLPTANREEQPATVSHREAEFA
jgi:hypothetical protein